MFTMRTAQVTVWSRFSMTQSLYYKPYVDERPRETAEQYEERTWMHRLHTTETGAVFIPVEAFKKCLENSASRLAMKVKGAGRQTFARRFLSDVQCEGDTPDQGGVLLHHLERDDKGNRIAGKPILATDAEPLRLHVSAQGKRGTGGTRVMRIFPVVSNWIAMPRFVVTDPAIDDDVFAKHLQLAGISIGIGTFRLENGGRFGRFFVEPDIVWEENDLDALRDAA